MLFRLAVILSLIFVAPANACIVAVPMELSDVFGADAVIVGRVVKYEIVEVGDRGPLPDYARFEILVRKTIKGDVSSRLKGGNRLTVTWDNSTFGEPEKFNRRKTFLFALRDPASPAPPLRGGSATILPNQEPEQFTILQAPCAGAFIFDARSAEGAVIQQVLETNRDPKVELEVLEEFLNRLAGGNGSRGGLY